MSAAVYTPRGYAKAAVDPLTTLGAGAALSSAVLAEAIEAEAAP